MRAAPSVTVTLGRPRLALAALGGLAATALAASAVWASSRQDGWAWAVVAAVILHAAWTLHAALRRQALTLRWDGVRWSLAEGAAGAPRPGTLSVALDLGGFLLLRFRADAAGPRRTRWLPAERAALAADWHALRCAVHSPQAPATAAAPDAPLRP